MALSRKLLENSIMPEISLLECRKYVKISIFRIIAMGVYKYANHMNSIYRNGIFYEKTTIRIA